MQGCDNVLSFQFFKYGEPEPDADQESEDTKAEPEKEVEEEPQPEPSGSGDCRLGHLTVSARVPEIGSLSKMSSSVEAPG